MRVAFWLGGFPALSETFILSQITGLIDRGIDVRIIAGHTPPQPMVHAAVRRYGLLERTIYLPKIQSSLLRRVVQGGEMILRHGVRHPLSVGRCANFMRYGGHARSLLMLHAFAVLSKAGPFDVVHAHMGPSAEVAARLIDAGVLHGKLIGHFHGTDVNVYPRVKGPGCYHFLFKRAAHLLTVSQLLRQRLTRLGAPPDRLTVHHVGVEVSPLGTAARTLHADRPVRLLTVARLVEVKGVEYAIRAVAKLHKRGVGLEYTIIGEGPLRGELEKLVESLALGKVVNFVGARQQQEVTAHLRQSDLFVLSSARSADGQEEGIPTVLMEAMACALPVLSTQHGGIPELVEDGKSGWLVPERDVAALADRLQWMLDHPDCWGEMGRAGRAKVEREFNIDTLNDRLVELYRQLAK